VEGSKYNVSVPLVPNLTQPTAAYPTLVINKAPEITNALVEFFDSFFRRNIELPLRQSPSHFKSLEQPVVF
jgi:hypothetical protein